MPFSAVINMLKISAYYKTAKTHKSTVIYNRNVADSLEKVIEHPNIKPKLTNAYWMVILHA